MKAETLVEYRINGGELREIPRDAIPPGLADEIRVAFAPGVEAPTDAPASPATAEELERALDLRPAPGARSVREQLSPTARSEASDPTRPPIRWEHLGHSRVAEIAKTDRKRFEALMADREFRREIGMANETDDVKIIARLQARKRPDLVARVLELREALRA